MPIETLLTHRVSVLRRVGVLDEAGEPVLDQRGQPVTTDDTRPGVAVAIQPKSAKERAAQHQAGAAVSTHTIYAVDRTITTAGAIIHDPAACPMTRDLPAGRYELSGTPDAAGVGHHLELDAVLVFTPGLGEAPPPGPSGSGDTGSGS